MQLGFGSPALLPRSTIPLPNLCGSEQELDFSELLVKLAEAGRFRTISVAGLGRRSLHCLLNKDPAGWLLSLWG